MQTMEASAFEPAHVLDFWFAHGNRDRRWFEKNPAFDSEVRARFLAYYEHARRGAFAHWKLRASECLALIVLLDQFPRNMFRGTAQAFATDFLALEVARHAVAERFDRGMTPAERLFVYLPFEHAESIEAQQQACALTEPLAAFPETHDAHHYALLHRDIIARFGRFPHRNALLGRPSTTEELEFLKGPASSF